PSEGELVRLFGKEAPDPLSVQKVTTYDANGTASVAYKTKDGKVIATALAVTASTGPLDALPSRAAGTQMIFQEVKGNIREDDHTVVSRKPLFFTTDTDVVVDYEITPGLIDEICSGLCKTCDYTIEFRLYKDGVQLPTY